MLNSPPFFPNILQKSHYHHFFQKIFSSPQHNQSSFFAMGMGMGMETSSKLQRTPLVFFFLLLYLPATVKSQYTTSTTVYASFDISDQSSLAVLGDASITKGALQLTPDTGLDITFLMNKSGRILLKNPINIWHLDKVASFNSSFHMNVFHQNETVPGEGIAFVIAPNREPPPLGSNKGYLGLTNSTLDGLPSNHIVAVEFDIFKQSYDIDNNHVGLDINSVHSNASASLTPLGIEISPVGIVFYHVWIEYDGAARYIRVFMTTVGLAKPTTPILNASLDLRAHLLPSSYFGFAGSTGDKYQLNCILAWNLTVEVLPSDDNDGSWSAWKLVTVILVPFLVVVLIAILLGGGYWLSKRISCDEDPMLLAGTLKCLPGMPQEFTFKELKKATNNFDERQKLGQGGFGIVYKGVLDNTMEVAVKKFSRDRLKGQDDFLSELTIINRLRHKHLVRLVGWCHRNNVLLLVYDYMPNGSLDQHLFCGGRILNWERRYNIVIGVASALQYLHNEYDQKVVHRDLKASNVMLDGGFNARLGDFGLARALDTDKTSYVDVELGGVPGTVGYIAPECFHTGKATRESDVFGFGAVVLEVACGRRPRCDVEGFQFLVDWVWKLHREGRILEALDPLLEEGDGYVGVEAERLLLLGLACSHPIAGERPKTQAIVQILSGSVPPPSVPSFKPAFVWPAGLFDDVSIGNSSYTTIATSSSYYGSSTG